MVERRKDRLGVLFLVGTVVLYIIVFSVLSIARYDTFHASTLDLGIMTQVVWNTAHGRWFETSIGRSNNETLIGNYLGNHVRPALLLLAPLYRLWPDPRLLLVLQSAALGGAAIPLYMVARQRIGSWKVALLIAFCYLAYPALGFLNLVDFHPIVFSIPCFYLAYWALLKDRKVLFWSAVLLALSTKEEIVIPVAAWGVVNLIWRKRWRIGSGLLVLAGVWAVLCLGLIIPYFNEGQPYRFWKLWAHVPGFSQPSVQEGDAHFFPAVSSGTIVLFLVHLALPLGFLPFFGPAMLIVAGPSLAYLLVGKSPAFHSVGYQYPAVLIPWFFLAVVEGARRTRRFTRRLGRLNLHRMGVAFLLFGTIGINVPLNPLLISVSAGIFRRDPYHAQIVEAMNQIPPEAGVATINRFGASLSNRRILVALEYPPPFRLDHVVQADYVLLDLVDCRLVPAQNRRAEYARIVAQVVKTGLFRVRYWSDRVLLLERGVPSEEELERVLTYVNSLVEQERLCWP